MSTDATVIVEIRVSVIAVVLTKTSVSVALHSVRLGCWTISRDGHVAAVPTSVGISLMQTGIVEAEYKYTISNNAII